MASLGDVTVDLKARTADFRRALQESGQDLRQLKADLASGRITLQQYGESMAAVRDRMLQFRGATGALNGKELSQFNSVLVATAPAAEKAGLTLRSLRSPLATLAAQSAGASGSVGQLTSILLTLGGGSGVAIAVAAAIGGVAAALKYFGKTAEEAHQKYKEYLDSLRKDSPLAKVGGELDAVREKIQHLQEAANLDIAVFGFIKPGIIQRLTEARRELAELTKQYNALKGGIEGVEEATNKAVALFDFNVQLTSGRFSAGKQTSKDWADINAEIRTFGEMIRAARDPLEKLKLEERLRALREIAFGASIKLGRNEGALTDSTRQGASAADQAAMVNAANAVGQGVSSAMLGIGGERGESANTARLKAKYKQLGEDLGEVIGNGMTRAISSVLFDNAKGLGDILKGILRGIFDELLGSLTRSFATKVATGLLDIGIGVLSGGIFSRAAPPGGETIVVPVSEIPPNPSPIAMARDAQHLALWAETERVARSMGVRLSLR